MKTAEDWILKSEPAMPLAPALTKTIIKAIQADALREAAEICNSRITSKDFTIEATRCRDAILARAKEVEKP